MTPLRDCYSCLEEEEKERGGREKGSGKRLVVRGERRDVEREPVSKMPGSRSGRGKLPGATRDGEKGGESGSKDPPLHGGRRSNGPHGEMMYTIHRGEDAMKRTQLYLTKNMWKVLHVRSRQQGTTISELVRQAVQEKYGSSPAGRMEAMKGLVGLRAGRKDLPETESYVRQLRKGKRLGRLKE